MGGAPHAPCPPSPTEENPDSKCCGKYEKNPWIYAHDVKYQKEAIYVQKPEKMDYFGLQKMQPSMDQWGKKRVPTSATKME